jgi:hypothetical protein
MAKSPLRFVIVQNVVERLWQDVPVVILAIWDPEQKVKVVRLFLKLIVCFSHHPHDMPDALNVLNQSNSAVELND